MQLEKWKAEFKKELGRQAALSGQELDSATDAELEDWLDDDEWKHCDPAAAVAENLSYWDE